MTDIEYDLMVERSQRVLHEKHESEEKARVERELADLSQRIYVLYRVSENLTNRIKEAGVILDRASGAQQPHSWEERFRAEYEANREIFEEAEHYD